MTNAPCNVLVLGGANQLRLAGRTAIVAGAGRGLGGAITELRARAGARVVIASRSAEGYGIRSLLSVHDNNGNSESEEE